MVTVILAEKEEDAKAYAVALGPVMKKGKVHIIPKSKYFSDEVHIVAAEGHLFEYGKPENSWSLDKLPLLDVSFKQTLKSDKTSKEYFNRIYKEVIACDQVIIGTDADREGERIAYSILSHIPGGKEKVKKRLWVQSVTTKALQKAFQELRDPSETYNYYLEAEARAQSDWLVGMNFTPLSTVELQNRGQIQHRKEMFSVGRVQTPIVRLICENDIAIRNFKPQTYWKLQLEDTDNNIAFSTKDKFTDSNTVLALSQGLSTTSMISSVEVEDKKKPAPSLFNLSDLQGLAASTWKFSSKKTENLVERLFLKGYLSYPRSEARHITEFEFEYLKENLKGYQEVIGCLFEPAFLEPRKIYVDAEKVAKTSHYALIPTEKIPHLQSLTPNERIIYQSVVRQTILMFADDCDYSITTVVLENNGQKFTSIGRQIKKLGWSKWSMRKVRSAVEIPDYKVGDKIPTQVSILDGVTKPPKRVTESQLISQLLPKYCLGTQSTRATIIQRIQERGYVTMDKKTGQLYPTPKAYLLINYLYDNEFSNPETTGGWELFLSQIGEGSISPREFVDAIKKRINDQIQLVKERSD